MSFIAVTSKPLPTVHTLDADLTPPSPYSPPPPPPKPSAVPPQLEDLQPPGPIDLGLSLPATPTTPTSPGGGDSGRTKKTNPLNDLIDTEKTYVDHLTGVIRKVAAAWSRSNLPPPELDTMFRSIEGVYKVNRSLMMKLKEIGTNPSSPKALGDLLMRWTDDLEAPYATYCSKYCSGFDHWQPVQSNPKLPQVLVTFSETHPPPLSTSGLSDPALWTLDALFLLPKVRLKYYKKLYSRLLKSTSPGRSDHRLLLGALEKLDGLLETLENREGIQVGASQSIPQKPPEVKVIVGESDSFPSQPPRSNNVEIVDGSRPSSDVEATLSSGSSSARGSSFSGGERLSRDTNSTSISRGSSSTMTTPVTDLERRLSTERTLDIFTMTPKNVRLQISPSSLTYTRELRFSLDATIFFTPRATGIEVVIERGHIFLLSDLFLICERMTPEEKSLGPPDGPDMWLCYPPLAGKVLRASDVPGQDNTVQISIMKKENILIRAESPQVRSFMLAEFLECTDFANSVGPASKQPPPPIPPLPPFNSPSREPSPSSRHSPQHLPGSAPHSFHGPSPPPSRDGRGMPPPDPMLRGPPPPGYPGPPPPFGPNQVLRSTSMGSHLNTANSMPLNMPANMRPSLQPGGLPLPPGPHHLGPPRPPSEPMYSTGHRASAGSNRSFHQEPSLPPLPPQGFPPHNDHFIPRSKSSSNLHAPQPRTILPSQFNSRTESHYQDPSPPASPVEEAPPTGPITSTISAQMKCKVFLKQQHAQWKSLGSAKLKLYRQSPTNIKQLVVEADNKEKSVLISTIVLTDGVERVGKTGVAIELSDKGQRTGIVYMIQLRNETSAGGLFDSLLAGSDRSGV